MGKHIHWFDKVKDFEKEYWGNEYRNPWVSYTEEDSAIHFERDEEEARWKNPLTFEIITSGTIGWKCQSTSSNYIRIIEYSLNDGPWTTWTPTTANTGATIYVKRGDVLKVRGNNATYAPIVSWTMVPGAGSGSSSNYYSKFVTTCKFNLSGNITSLINSEDFNVTELTENWTFYSLFSSTGVVNAKNLRLPLTTLTKGCYANLFSGCRSLVSCPELPATTIPEMGYAQMFYGCESLTEMPDFPTVTVGRLGFGEMFHNTNLTTCKNISVVTAGIAAFQGMFSDCTQLVEPLELPLSNDLPAYCYYSMFSGCTSLTNVPELPALTLSEACYGRMFYGCTSLVNAPELPATTLAQKCYENMFDSCTSLIEAPVLSSLNMEAYCYSHMFYNCTSLTDAPELPATNLANYCYTSMFQGCENLTEAPELTASILFEGCYSYMFYGCKSLTEAPELNSTYLAKECYAYMFYKCTSLTSIPELLATQVYQSSYAYMFYGCTGLTSVSSDSLCTSTVAASSYSNMFSNCTNLVNVSLSLSATTLESQCYRYMFYNTGLTSLSNITIEATTLANSCCSYMFAKTKITEVPSGFLPATTLATSCYYYMFSDCNNLTTVSENLLPATTLDGANSCYSYMFYNCKSLGNTPILPATTLSSYCYESMFRGCSNLTSITTLPAITIAQSCYNYMFGECTSLTTAPDLPATTLANSCYTNMFYGCIKLTSAPTISAQTLASSCCSSMFKNCSKLTVMPTLSATTLQSYCYQEMFYNCTSLTTLAETLPATTLTSYCYKSMFYGCTSLTTIPSGFLPATTMKSYCYADMFSNCSSLINIPYDLLPATTLESYCYNDMFRECSKITMAPILPATTLPANCYYCMFYDCKKLGFVKCLAESKQTNSCTSWLKYCPLEGDFIKSDNVSDSFWERSESGIPTGWTILDSGNYVYLSKSIVNSQAETINLTGYLEGNWTLTKDVDWITVSSSSGSSGYVNITLQISQCSNNARTGHIVITCGNYTKTLEINQWPSDYDNFVLMDNYKPSSNERVDLGIIDTVGQGYLKVNYAQGWNPTYNTSPHIWINYDDSSSSYMFYRGPGSATSTGQYQRIALSYNNTCTYNDYVSYLTTTNFDAPNDSSCYIKIENGYIYVKDASWTIYKRASSSHTNLNNKYVIVGGYRGKYGCYTNSNPSTENWKSIEINSDDENHRDKPLVLLPYKDSVTNEVWFMSDDLSQKHKVKDTSEPFD